MTRFTVLFVLFLSFPIASFSTTSHDLRWKIAVDGNILEYEADEWVLDPETWCPEKTGDSRWGRDNDIHRIAVTWDLYHVYIAVSCVTFNSTLMIFLDSDCGGVESLEGLDFFYRNIRFADFSPNLLLEALSAPPFAAAATVGCSRPLELLDPDSFEVWFRQDGLEGGAFETAIPWEMLGHFERSGQKTSIPGNEAVLRLLTVVTGGPGTGAGDAAPDPSSILENDSTRLAVCDNVIQIPLDADADGFLDMGVSPREAATFSLDHGGSERQVLPLRLELAENVFSPDIGEVLSFSPFLNLEYYSLPVYLTARVYTSSGELISVIYEDLPRNFSRWERPVWDQWDGKSLQGEIVPGGIYILAVTGGPAKGSMANIVKASFAVIR